MQEKRIKYPLKFYPVLKQTLWGGNKILPYLSLENEIDKNGIAYSSMEHVGECWAVSAIEGFESVVSNGPLAGKSLPELVGVYKNALLGKKNYERYGCRFPLLVKFIDAAQDLSVQVHPNDEMAAQRHNCSGKNEMWYVLDAEKNAKLLSGFSRPIIKEQYRQMSATEVVDALQSYDIKAGDIFYLPAGTIHSIGSGAFIAEIQQSSDITYRIYDFDRRDKNGNFRELHTNLATDAIDFEAGESCKVEYNDNLPVSDSIWDNCVELIKGEHFSTRLIKLGSKTHDYKEFEFDYGAFGSFVILTCTKGSCSIVYASEERNLQSLTLERGGVVLLPADLERVSIGISGSSSCELLETHI